jgi:hypothetical protein
MMIRTSSAVAVAVAVVMGLVLVSCSGDDDATGPVGEEEARQPSDGSGGGGADAVSDDPQRQVYEDAFVASFGSDEQLSDDERRCFGVAIVDSVGTGKLSALTPEEVSRSAAKVPSELGVEVTQEEGEVFYDALSECVDIEGLFARGFAEEDDGACLLGALDGDLLRDFYVTLYVLGSDAFMDDTELMTRIQTAAAECEP